MAIRLLTRLVCKPYASNHARPVGSSALMGASPGWTRGVGPAPRVGSGTSGAAVRRAVPGQVPAAEPRAASWARPRRPASPAVGPLTVLRERRSRRRRPHRSCPLSRNACGPPRWRPDAPRARPAQTTVHPAPPQALAGAHGETMVWHAIVDGGRLRPRLACPPVGRVPTYRQRVLGTAPLDAAHRRTALLLCQGMQAPAERPYALAWCLLCSEGMGAQVLSRPLQSRGTHGARASPTGGTRCARHDEREEVSTVP